MSLGTNVFIRVNTNNVRYAICVLRVSYFENVYFNCIFTLVSHNIVGQFTFLFFQVFIHANTIRKYFFFTINICNEIHVCLVGKKNKYFLVVTLVICLFFSLKYLLEFWYIKFIFIYIFSKNSSHLRFNFFDEIQELCASLVLKD